MQLSSKVTPAFEKYKRMLTCGLSKGAVIHKMRQDGLCPPLVDSRGNEKIEQVEEDKKSATSASETESENQSYEKELARLKKLLKAGLSIQAVKTKMELAGIEAPPGFFDDVETPTMASQASCGTNAMRPDEALEYSRESLTKYQNMLKCGLSEGAVRHKMTQDGVGIPDGFFQSETHDLIKASDEEKPKITNTEEEQKLSLPVQTPNSQLGLTSSGQNVEFDDLTKYRKMLKCGLPEGAVRHKMEQDGMSVPEDFFLQDVAKNEEEIISEHEDRPMRPKTEPSESLPPFPSPSPLPPLPSTTLFDEASETEKNTFTDDVPSASSLPPPELPPALESGVDSNFEKYRKMLKCGLSEGAVRHKMSQDGVNIPDSFFDSSESEPAIKSEFLPSPTPVKGESRLGRLRRLSSRRKSSLAETSFRESSFPFVSKENVDTPPGVMNESTNEGNACSHGDKLDLDSNESNLDSNESNLDSNEKEQKEVAENDDVNEIGDEGQEKLAQLEREEAAQIAQDLREAEERKQKAVADLQAAERAEQERLEAEKRLAEMRARQEEEEQRKREEERIRAEQEAIKERERREREEFERIKREIKDVLQARIGAEINALKKEYEDTKLFNLADDSEAVTEKALDQANRRCELAQYRSERIDTLIQDALLEPFTHKSSGMISDGKFWRTEKELVEVSLECDRLSETLAETEKKAADEAAFIETLEKTKIELEEACVNAELPEDIISQHIKRLEASLPIDLAIFRQTIRALECSKADATEELRNLDSRDKTAYLAKYEALVAPDVARFESEWEKRFIDEEKDMDGKLKELSQKSKRAKQEILSSTEARFKSGFNKILAELDSEKARTTEQLAETQHRTEQILGKVADLAKAQGALPSDTLANSNFLQMASPEQVDNVVDECIADRKIAAADSQRASIHKDAQRLSQAWLRMCELGLEDQQVKHQLSFLYKAEQAVPYSEQVLSCYQRKIAELQDAIPIFETLKERDGLQRSVDLCHDFLKEQDLTKVERESHQAAQQVVDMLKRETDALRWSTVRAAKLVQSWEDKHGIQFCYC